MFLVFQQNNGPRPFDNTTHREKVMLRAADAIILDENFGPKAKEEKEKMPALHSTNLLPSKRYSISLGAGPRSCS